MRGSRERRADPDARAFGRATGPGRSNRRRRTTLRSGRARRDHASPHVYADGGGDQFRGHATRADGTGFGRQAGAARESAGRRGFRGDDGRKRRRRATERLRLPGNGAGAPSAALPLTAPATAGNRLQPRRIGDGRGGTRDAAQSSRDHGVTRSATRHGNRIGNRLTVRARVGRTRTGQGSYPYGVRPARRVRRARGHGRGLRPRRPVGDAPGRVGRIGSGALWRQCRKMRLLHGRNAPLS